MKTHRSIMALIVLLLLISLESFASIQPSYPVVSAPVDGGLLALLAGAGIAWFVVRKRNRNKAD